MRAFVATILCAFVGLTAACTTSRAVLAYHDGWRAEQQGQASKALQHYDEALSLDGSLVGAACNRARLLAMQPDRRAEAKESIDKLMKAKGTVPEAAACGALFALADGDAKLARQRLDVARPLKDTDAASVREAMAAVRVQVLAAEARWPEVVAAAVQLAPDATAAHLSVEIARWNATSAVGGAAAAVLPPSPQAADLPVGHALQAWMAAMAGQWPEVMRQVAAVPESARPAHLDALRAWAQLQAGDVGGALATATAAARRDAQDEFCAETWGIAALAAANPAQARDILGAATLRGGGWTAWYHLGLAQVQLGDLAGALAAFEQAATRCPHCAPAVKNRDALRKAMN